MTDTATVTPSAPPRRRAPPVGQTSAYLGSARMAWLTARAAAAGQSRVACLLALWPRDPDGALALVPPRHPRAALPVPLRAYTSHVPALEILTLHGPDWIDAGGAALRDRLAANGRSWPLSAVVRAVVDAAVEAGA